MINDAEPRKGVPQGRHVHTLLASGAAILRAYFPDLFAALAQDGAVPLGATDIRRYQLGVRMAAVPIATRQRSDQLFRKGMAMVTELERSTGKHSLYPVAEQVHTFTFDSLLLQLGGRMGCASRLSLFGTW